MTHRLQQEKNAELREEVAWHEQQRLKSWAEGNGPHEGLLRPDSGARDNLGAADVKSLADGFGREMAQALVEVLGAEEDVQLAGSGRELADEAAEGVRVDGRGPSSEREPPSTSHVPQSRPEEVAHTGAAVGQVHGAAEGGVGQHVAKGQRSLAVGEHVAQDSRASEQGSQGSSPHGTHDARSGWRHDPTQAATGEAGQGALQQAGADSSEVQAGDRAGAQPGTLPLPVQGHMGDGAAPPDAPEEALYGARPQRAPAQPLPPVPRFDKCALDAHLTSPDCQRLDLVSQLTSHVEDTSAGFLLSQAGAQAGPCDRRAAQRHRAHGRRLASEHTFNTGILHPLCCLCMTTGDAMRNAAW